MLCKKNSLYNISKRPLRGLKGPKWADKVVRHNEAVFILVPSNVFLKSYNSSSSYFCLFIFIINKGC